VRLGAADYVLKPGDPEGVGEAALESAIRNALERESLSAEVEPEIIDELVESDGTEGVNLQALARTAAMRAEREAIDQALARFRWNRRKAAAYLNVSYKTLLNKMKECGISDSGSS
jgi:DNA-binding NtrC family response regulator